jgi:type IV secretory pathway protease TraF
MGPYGWQLAREQVGAVDAVDHNVLASLWLVVAAALTGFFWLHAPPSMSLRASVDVPLPLEPCWVLWEDRGRIPTWMPWIKSVKATGGAVCIASHQDLPHDRCN